MNNFSKFSDVLKAVIDYGGKEILKDKRKTNNYIGDLIPGDNFQKEKKLLNDAYSCNAVSILLDADESAARREKAVETAKNKLIDSMSLSESGASLILKEICDALGWNTQQLFSNTTAPERAQSAAPKENKNVSLNKEYYNQPIISNTPINANKVAAYAEQMPVTTTQTVKKKSPWGTVLKVAAIIIVIGVIYNIGKSDGSETVIIDETEPAVSSAFSETYSETTAVVATTEALAVTAPINNENSAAENSEQAFNDNAAEAALIAPNLDTETTTEMTTQEVTTTVDPRAGKYVVTDIAKFVCSEYNCEYDRLITYDSSENSIYYLTETEDVHKYNLSDKSDTIILTLDGIVEKIIGGSSNVNSLTSDGSDDISKFGIDGVIFNQYTNKVYVLAHGYTYTHGLCFYDVKTENITKFVNHNGIRNLSFINENEFFVPNPAYNTWSHYDFSTCDSKRITVTANFYRIVDINDNYYAIMTNGGVKKFSNVYNAEYNEIFSFEFSGTDVKDNTLYYKDWENNVYKTDLDNLTKEIYISVDDIFQNGKEFLGSGQCTGLYMTNDGGFITYDKSDSKLKYVSMNY
ncbi:MAG: hypothetical protein NC253_12900 [Ruminococcus sp.]|nr:hypothetical protein [Ruminococcus sp.]MCM1381579.1 hypothetical protein [Muribaculaceae bacterium]MCM1479331.1 hypothetical protein [Muribaculaceae bacterium]